MKVLVAEDEPLAARRLVAELEKLTDINIAGPYKNGIDARQGIVEHRPDVVLLDVQMPGVDGFDLLESLEPHQTPLVIFTTAFKRYAIAAIKAGAIDYLLKPIDTRALVYALDKASLRLQEREAGLRTGELRSLVSQLRSDIDEDHRFTTEFWVKGKKQNTRVGTHELEVIEAVRDYVLLHTQTHSYLRRGKISEIEKELNPKQFIRAHRSYILNLKFVSAYRKSNGGTTIIRMASGRDVRVGRKYTSLVKIRL